MRPCLDISLRHSTKRTVVFELLNSDLIQKLKTVYITELKMYIFYEYFCYITYRERLISFYDFRLTLSSIVIWIHLEISFRMV